MMLHMKTFPLMVLGKRKMSVIFVQMRFVLPASPNIGPTKVKLRKA